ncbi:MAG: lysophospholipid acyltransferase family protein [Desulfovibrionaceae bacterium]
MRIDPALFAPLLSLVCRLWTATLRITYENQIASERAAAQGRKLVFALWHDELFACFSAKPKDISLVAVVSSSADGELLAGPLERQGVRCARGSSSKGGLKAMREIMKIMEATGRHGVITVDGPRGPRHQAKEGALYLAHKSGAAIVPVRSFMARRYVFRKAWDQFQLPLPFSRVRVVFGDPYDLAPTDKLTTEYLAQETRRLEQRLERMV